MEHASVKVVVWNRKNKLLNEQTLNNTENVPEYSEKQKKQYNDAIKAYDHTGNGVSWSQFEWKTYDTQMTVTFEDSVKVESISKNGKFKCIMEPYPGNELDF